MPLPTIRLIYASDAHDELVYRDFLEIMERAGEANRAMAITGILCYGGGKFLQALEGERAVVNALYHHIAQDPRHEHCQLLCVEDITEREFGEWSMKIIDWGKAGMAARREATLSRAGLHQFDPAQMSGAEATMFLVALAAEARALME
jgi:hypothetical protein